MKLPRVYEEAAEFLRDAFRAEREIAMGWPTPPPDFRKTQEAFRLTARASDSYFQLMYEIIFGDKPEPVNKGGVGPGS